MDCCFDRTGFPYLELNSPALAVSLLPLTKLQFERYLADLTPPGDTYYEEILKLNPRVAPGRFTPEQRERLFITGLRPAEAQAFAAWLGEGYRLPTLVEWRAIYGCFQAIAFASLAHDCLTAPAGFVREAALLHRWQEQCQPHTLLDFSLLNGGVVEWVRDRNTWVGLGAPRPSFKPNLWDPLSDVLTPTHPGQRLAFFGARLVRDVAKIP